MSYLPLFYLVVTIILTSVAQLLQKQAAVEMNRDASALLTNISFIASGLFMGVALITWLQVLNSVEVSIAYPMLSLNYITVLLLAKLFFKERIPRHRWIGVACIMAGVSILASGSLV